MRTDYHLVPVPPAPGGQQPVGGPDTHYVRTGYCSRAEVAYFVDEPGDVVWQPDVYPYTAEQALRHDCDVVIDLGCGRAGKLAAMAAEHPAWTYVGVDVGTNLAWCQENLPFGIWVDADLETCERLPLDADLVRRSIIVCSDVLEHLLDPAPALGLVRGLLAEGGTAAVLSTPAREHRSGYADPGPPCNPSHVREWASDEFQALLTAAGFEIHETALTRSDDSGGGLTTQLVLVDFPGR